MQLQKKTLFFTIFLLQIIFAHAQEKLVVDTSGKVIFSKNIKSVNDSTAKKYNPAIAIRRSAILPGWGQYTNKKYWKIPLVYAGIGIPAYLFTRNLKQYKKANAAIYGRDATSRMILEGRADKPSDAVVSFRDKLEESTAKAATAAK